MDDAAAFLKNDSIDYILEQLNSFHEKIQFTFEVENNNRLPFLDALLIKKINTIGNRKVYSKPTNTDGCLNWSSSVLAAWKTATLRTILNHAYIICFTESHLQDETRFIESTFEKINNHPKYVINRIN